MYLLQHGRVTSVPNDDNPVLANLKGKRGIERKYPGGSRSTNRKNWKQKAYHNYSERTHKYKVFRKGRIESVLFDLR